MSDHNHTGFIWDHAMNGVNRHKGPSKASPKILPALHAGQSLIVLCYSLGDDMEFPNPFQPNNTSNAWDFVVTSDQDPGGYVADVYVNTGGDIRQQLGAQGKCDLLKQSFAPPPAQTHHEPRG